jgi:prolipoprotein diacylglyceryltransferase
MFNHYMGSALIGAAIGMMVAQIVTSNLQTTFEMLLPTAVFAAGLLIAGAILRTASAIEKELRIRNKKT